MHAILVDFSELLIDGPTEDDACIMIPAARSPVLMQLQHRVLDLYVAFYRRLGFVETGRPLTDETALHLGEKPIPEIEMVRRGKKGE